MALLSRLLKQLRRGASQPARTYVLHDALHPVVDSLAEAQQRSPDEMASNLVGEALTRRQVDANLLLCWQALSPREQQVAALTCLNFTNPQIAARLGLAVETVRTHTRNVQIKFNVNSKADLRVLLAGWDFSDFATS